MKKKSAADRKKCSFCEKLSCYRITAIGKSKWRKSRTGELVAKVCGLDTQERIELSGGWICDLCLKDLKCSHKLLNLINQYVSSLKSDSSGLLPVSKSRHRHSGSTQDKNNKSLG